MSYIALARKWRPQIFNDVVGQEHVVQALGNALDSGRVHHAFLFEGTRGVGKTTIARIFAKALNCEQGVSSNPCGECSACVAVDEGRFVDLLEVDAASRTRVDDTRELLDNVQYAPSMGRYKIYLIDEVHMLSTHSFNALLKTLEEPPEHVKFLLATTDPQKLPVTILSRCLQFGLRALRPEQIEKQLAAILKKEDINFETEALQLIARAADGSMRDGLSLLDQAIALGKDKVEQGSVRTMLGTISGSQLLQLVQALCQNDALAMTRLVNDMVGSSADFGKALNELLVNIYHASLNKVSPEAFAALDGNQDAVSALSEQFSAEHLQLLYQIGVLGKRDLHLAPDTRTGMEMTLLRMLAFEPGDTEDHHPGSEDNEEIGKPMVKPVSDNSVDTKADTKADTQVDT
ncbi:MAG: DNA polymerase III subunit gamma/tau, partial [Proteobacteria bacterium]|nr:DNA polymerase III subunit gamma/tau [Pseudomonadota bacterium]